MGVDHLSRPFGRLQPTNAVGVSGRLTWPERFQATEKGNGGKANRRCENTRPRPPSPRRLRRPHRAAANRRALPTRLRDYCNYCGGRLNCAQSIRLLMSRPFDRTPPKRHDGRAIECRSRKSSLTNFLDNCPSDTGNYSRDGVTGMFSTESPKIRCVKWPRSSSSRTRPTPIRCSTAVRSANAIPRRKNSWAAARQTDWHHPGSLFAGTSTRWQTLVRVGRGNINAALSEGCVRFEWMHRRLDGSPCRWRSPFCGRP